MILLQCLAYTQSHDSLLKELQVLFGTAHFLLEEMTQTRSVPSAEQHRRKEQEASGGFPATKPARGIHLPAGGKLLGCSLTVLGKVCQQQSWASRLQSCPLTVILGQSSLVLLDRIKSAGSGYRVHPPWLSGSGKCPITAPGWGLYTACALCCPVASERSLSSEFATINPTVSLPIKLLPSENGVLMKTNEVLAQR